MPGDEYFEVSNEDVVSDEAADEWDNEPTIPRYRHSNFGENQLD